MRDQDEGMYHTGIGQLEYVCVCDRVLREWALRRLWAQGHFCPSRDSLHQSEQDLAQHHLRCPWRFGI